MFQQKLRLGFSRRHSRCIQILTLLLELQVHRVQRGCTVNHEVPKCLWKFRGKLLWRFEQESSVLGLPACTLETILHRQSDHILKCYNADIQDYIFRLNLSCRARGLYFTLPQKWKRVAKKQKKTSATKFYLWTFGQFAFYWAFFFKFVNEHLSDKVNRFVSKLSFRNQGVLSLEAEVKIILFECFI